MRLYEYQAKELLKSNGIRIPTGIISKNIENSMQISTKMDFPVILKPQILLGGRGKEGMIRTVSKPSQLSLSVDELMNTETRGMKPDSILVEEFVPHNNELYISIALDRGKRSFILIVSNEGGIEIESVGKKIIRELNFDNFSKNDSREIGIEMKFSEKVIENFSKIIFNLITLSFENDAELVEINPLVLLDTGEFTALDAKIIIDDNALYRHHNFKPNLGSWFDLEAAKNGFSFVELDGKIGIVGNGAGLVLSTLDLVSEVDLDPACFLDLGGGASFDRILSALSLVEKSKNVERILLNIFGGITSCVDVAKAIVEAYKTGSLTKPIYLRIAGSEEEEARNILSTLNLEIHRDVENAIYALKQDV